MALQALSTSQLFNSFAVFREILQGITSFTSIFPAAEFAENDRYFEDEPNVKNRNFPGFPIIVIETDMDDEHITYTDLKQMNYTTRVMIYTDYFAERDTPRLSTYMNAIADYFNTNQRNLFQDYGIDGIKITKGRDRDEIEEKQLIVGTLTFDYLIRLDVE